MQYPTTAIVTGGGDGIGAAIAREFARHGMRVVIAEIDRDKGAAVAESLVELGGEGLFIETDVTQAESVAAMTSVALQQLGQVDVLVNNAYPTGEPLVSVADVPVDRVWRAMDAGFGAALTAMRAVYPGMARRQWGRIINLCSLNGVNAHAGAVDYNCAKEALRTLTRTAAVEWGRDGVTVNAVCPGAATSAFKMMEAHAPQMIEQINQLIPMGYSGDPDRDIAPVVMFLASEGARYMTGNTLFVDGGGHINGVPWKPE